MLTEYLPASKLCDPLLRTHSEMELPTATFLITPPVIHLYNKVVRNAD